MYNTFSDQRFSQGLEEYGRIAPKGLNNILLLDAPPSYERHYTPHRLQAESGLHCPLCEGPVRLKPQPIPIMPLVCKVISTSTDAGASGGADLLLSHDLDQFFQ